MSYCPNCGAQKIDDICANCEEISKQSTMSFSPVSAVGGTKPTQVTAPLKETKPTLVVIKGPQMGDSFYLNPGVTTLGRDVKADIFLNSRTVSRKHATLTQVANTVILQDLGSLNGTYVNGNLVDEAEIHDGDKLQIGTFLLKFHT